MTPHWTMTYLGKPWTKEKDCLYWYRKMKEERFGRTVPTCVVDIDGSVRKAIRVLRGDITEAFGYHKVQVPVEGDAVFLSQGRESSHIGMVFFLRGKMHVIHCLEGVGMVQSSLIDLGFNGWKVMGYLSDENREVL